MDKKCPKCQGQFKTFKYRDSDFYFDMCQGCHGLWLGKPELWSTLKLWDTFDAQAKKQFKKSSLVDAQPSAYVCPSCSSQARKMVTGYLPTTDVALENCSHCDGFFLDKGEYQKLKNDLATAEKSSSSKQIIATDAHNIIPVHDDHFSSTFFYKQLKAVRDDARDVVEYQNRPDKRLGVSTFFGRIKSAYALMAREPEIILFTVLQGFAIFIAYLLWIQAIDWIPTEVWQDVQQSVDKNQEVSGHGGADAVLFLWGMICIIFAAFPIGLCTAAICAVCTLQYQDKNPTFWKCINIVLHKAWSLWIFSSIDGYITVKRIIDRLPSKDKKRNSILKEALYYAWKLGTCGIVPALVSSNSTWQACKSSIAFLKHKSSDIILLRAGYSVLNWVIGVCAYIGALFVVGTMNIKSEEIYAHMYEAYYKVALPIFIAVAAIQLFLRPIYIISLTKLYIEYLIETQQAVVTPKPNILGRSALYVFLLLIVLIIVVILGREALGIMDLVRH